MSTKSKASKAVAPVAGAGKSLALLDQELSQEVDSLKEQIGQPGGRQIKVEPSGNFKSPEGLDLGNTIQIVVLDFISRKAFYSGPYNPNNIVPPDCYALGKNIAQMKPDDPNLPAKQSDACAGCPLNQFGSGNTGTGKACREFRDLAVLLVDPDNPELHNAPDAPIYTISVPPTSLKAFDAVVPVIARSLAGPPIKAILTVNGVANGTYALLKFTDPVPNPDYGAHVARRAETVDLLNRRPDYAAAAARQVAPPQRRGPAPVRPGARPAPARAAAGGRR